MALKFKLVMRKNLGEDHESIPEKVYAQMVYGDLVTFDEFAEEVADSSGAECTVIRHFTAALRTYHIKFLLFV